MPRRIPKITIANFGKYTTWDRTSNKLPKLLKYTTTVEAVVGNEFGIIIDVDNYKGKVLEFIIKHPPILNTKGNLMPQFKGELFVHSNHTQFFVGDGIWLPINDKVGEWEVIILYEGKKHVSKKFQIVIPE